jgi:type I restriction enzyme S subunit
MRNGWAKRRLRDVTSKIGSGATPLGGEAAYKTSGISLIRSLNVHDGGFRTKDLALIDDTQAARLDNVIVQTDDVLLNITGASVARCCVVPSEHLPARVNQHVSIIRSVKQILLPRFLHFMLISRDYKNRLLAVGEDGGSTRQAITKAQLQEFEVEFPPLAEQQRIVGLLDEAFAGLATAQAHAAKNLQNARALFESHLQSVFTQRGPGWVEKPLSALSEPGRIITYGVVQLGEEVPDGVPCLRTSNVRWLRIETEGMKRIAAKLSGNYSRTILRGGEVLVNVRGSLGGVAVASESMRGWNISREVAVAPVDSRKADPRFVALSIGAGVSQKWLGGVKKGAAYVGINIEDLRNLPVHHPPLEDQARLVSHLDALSEETQRLAALYTRKLAALEALEALEALKKSLLHQAFTGQL